MLILGARSDIGKAVAHRFASQGYDLQLAARRAATLEADKADLELRHGVAVTLHEFDVLTTEAHDRFVQALPVLPDCVVCAVGVMGSQDLSEEDVAHASQILRVNFEGPACIMGVLANRFQSRGSGTLIGISSVAGERGRGSNYTYGAAKAGFTAFLSGLRNRLARYGVHVVTVLPGPVETRMTVGLTMPSFLVAQPQEVAVAIWRAARRRHSIVYVRPIWSVIMAILRSVPEVWFKRLNL